SCTKEEKDIDTFHKIMNNSDHNINIYSYYKSAKTDSLLLVIEKEKEFHFKEMGTIGSNPFDKGDSLIIIYDDSIMIKHTRNIQQAASRSLMLDENWNGGKINEIEYRFEYIFTNDDYKEALDNQ
ncbi:MAG: hypothetical protein U9R32_07920, partial [Bacteroidota bacterium]|nr:hypothetical protein [Bacteroidota bacterium]